MYVLGIVITSLFWEFFSFQPPAAIRADAMADQDIGFRINGKLGH
jgi:hypothetical protein